VFEDKGDVISIKYNERVSMCLRIKLTLSLYFIGITSPLSSNTYWPFHCTLLRSHLLYPQIHTYPFIVLYWDHISFILKHILTISLYFIEITSPNKVQWKSKYVFEDKGDVISIKYNERVMSYISLVGDKYKIILYTYHLFLINVKQKKQKKLL
jgi:hypothetical protein